MPDAEPWHSKQCTGDAAWGYPCDCGGDRIVALEAEVARLKAHINKVDSVGAKP